MISAKIQGHAERTDEGGRRREEREKGCNEEDQRKRKRERERDGDKVEKGEEGREERGRSSASFVTSSGLVSAETKRGVGEATHSSEKIMQTVRKRRSIPKVRVRA